MNDVSYSVTMTIRRQEEGGEDQVVSREMFGFDDPAEMMEVYDNGFSHSSDTYQGMCECEIVGDELTFAQLRKMFEEQVLPSVIAQYGPNDIPAIHQSYNDWTDGLCKDGIISPWQYQNDPGYPAEEYVRLVHGGA